MGKGTIRGRILEYHHRSLKYSISMTTRPPRPGEVDGIDYYFVDRPQFEAGIDRQGFLEYARYVDDYYGTPREPVESMLEQGLNVLLEIEVQGALQVAQQAPQAILIFVVPPSLSELRHRLLLRGTDSLDKIDKRLRRAEEEMRSAHLFHYLVINDQLDRAVSDFSAILKAEGLRYSRMQDAVELALSSNPIIDQENAVLEEKIRKSSP